MLEMTNPSDELQLQVLRYLLWNENPNSSSTANRTTTNNNTTTTVQQSAVDTVLLAREKAVRHPLVWNAPPPVEQGITSQTDSSSIKKDTVDLSPPPPPPSDHHPKEDTHNHNLQQHLQKSMTQIHTEAVEQTIFLKQHLPSKYYKAVLSMLQDYVGTNQLQVSSSNENDENNHQPKPPPPPTTLEDKYEPERVAREQQKPPMRVLGPPLHKAVPTHLHLIGPTLAQFLYVVNPPSEDHSASSSNTDNDDDDDEEEEDVHVRESRQAWDKARTKFTETFLQLQEELLQVVQEEQENQMNESSSSSSSSSTAISTAIQEGEEEVKDQPQEVVSSKKIKKGRMFHVRFQVRLDPTTETGTDTAQYPPEVIPDESSSSSPLSSSAAAANTANSIDNLVFLDNLPVDTTQEEITELYSRCGTIKSIQICNQRLDLDPGPLNKVQLEERRRKQLKSVSARHNKVKWHRPKTPVYAIVEFMDHDGYLRAIDGTLCVFGMLIRRHPVRSIPAHRLSSLFIENLVDGYPCPDLEYELEQALGGMEVFLQPGQNLGVKVGSCEVIFPSFDIAWDAWSKLQELTPVQEQQADVQWFRTLKDAEQWWKRERGFDF
jgi:hypothetical protein